MAKEMSPEKVEEFVKQINPLIEQYDLELVLQKKNTLQEIENIKLTLKENEKSLEKKSADLARREAELTPKENAIIEKKQKLA